jgi:NitT/TauT family transport system permease protein
VKFKKNPLNNIRIIFSIFLLVGVLLYALGGYVNYDDASTLDQYKLKLDLYHLPFYAALSLIRILIALVISCALAIYIGKKMAISPESATVGIQIIDVLQSIPLEIFLSLSTTVLLFLIPHNLWGAQLAVIFALITAQVWNLILSVHESLGRVGEYKELIKIYKLSPSYVFLNIEMPLILPKLIWNSMLSLSASWFLIASSEEMFIIKGKSCITFIMPGIGGVIKEASLIGDLAPLYGSMVAIAVSIFMCNFFVFEPLLNLSSRLSIPQFSSTLIRTFHLIIKFLDFLFRAICKLFHKSIVILTSLCIIAYVGPQIIISTVPRVIVTGLRIFIVLLFSSLFGVPLGVFIGTSKTVLKYSRSLIQLISSLPINLAYSGIFILVRNYSIPFDICCVGLMSIGSLWCIVFNVIDAASRIPTDYWKLVKVMKLSNYACFTQLVWPSVLESYVTGLLAASGAAWNASLICEYLNWKFHTLCVYGIGSYLAKYSGSLPELSGGVLMMCIFIFIINYYFWNPMITYVKNRYHTE